MNPYAIKPPFVISFSGGRTSAYMLAKIIEAHGGKMPADGHVCFANTGREHPTTLDFVRDCENGFGCEVHWLERDFDAENTVRRVTYETASRNGEPFAQLIKRKKALPNAVMRFCTQELKVVAISRYMKSIGVDSGTMVVGLRADEERRVRKVHGDHRQGFDYECPMHKAGVTIATVNEFWKSMPFDLRLPNDDRAFGNCDLCFLKGRGLLHRVLRHEPGLGEWWAAQEEASGRTFTKGKTYRSMLVQLRVQPELFDKQPDGDDDETMIPCVCTE